MIRSSTNLLRMSLGGLLLASVSAPSLAFAATDQQPAEASAAAEEAGLGTIVVTATKRETDLQETPIAISVIDPTVMKDRHVQSLFDLTDGAIPSLRVATFEARQSALTVGIRGIVPFDQNQTARDTGVGVYVDGVYLGRSQGLNAALFDVERLEVLRGPQGTLFGRNTEGGAVSIVTKAPTGEFGGRFMGGIGNYGSYNSEIHLNLPAFANIALKFDGVIQHQDATVKNPLPGNYGWNYYNRYGGRTSALWKPVDGLSVEVAYDQAKDENTPFYSQLVNYNPTNLPIATLANGKLSCAAAKCINPLSPLVVVSGDNRMKVADIGVPQQLSVDRTHGVSSTIKYDATSNLQLRSITAWRGVTTAQWDNSGGAHRTVFAPNALFSRYSLSDLTQHQFSQEFQAVGSLTNLDYVVGLYYFQENARESAATPSSNQWNADGTAYSITQPQVFGPITSSNQGWAYGSRFIQRDSHATAHSYAAFAQATWTPAGMDMLHLTVGGRYTRDKRSGALTMVSGVPTPWTFSFDNDRFDPMATLAFDMSKDVHLYAKYATGYRAGGANDRSSNFGAFGPEKVKSYEVGAKMDMLDHKVRLNLAGYIMDRKGTQIDFDHVDTSPTLANGAPNPTFNLHTEDTANAPGTSKIRGIEADFTTNPIDGLTIGASYAYTYTKIPATPNPQLAGNPLTQVFVVFTPRNAASGYIDYEVPVSVIGGDTKLRFHVDGNYADSMYSFQNEPTKTDSSFIVNGRIALADIRMNDHGQTFTVSAWSRNLFNEAHIYRRSAANAATLGDYANFNAPRTWGIEGTVNF
ncbi:TonB-dependent receptor [Sphingobium estronivorans]|uniref:TonB-dependent receptor n=1 Tax=Sphingobium estronivorans TaxID=1577690 RepID=UPI001F07D71A|nr:TonB-dependent receptor [Sphingobium estronivorans]